MATKRQIDLFLSDPDYLELIELQREQRLLFITDLTETRVSAFLAWLFRPHEGHGLGDRALRELLITAWRKAHDDELDIDVPEPRRIGAWSFRDLVVITEYQVTKPNGNGRGRAIDMLLVSRQNQLMVAIENKFGSSVHGDQLKVYREELSKQFDGYQQVFIYLDSNEDATPDDEEWVGLSYGWLINLISAQQESGLLSERALDALEQVKEYLNQDAAVADDIALERDRLMTAIAEKHSAVLDEFRRFKLESAYSLLEFDKEATVEPLLIEYIQRRQLWSQVLEQAKHVQIIAPIKKVFGENLEVGVGAAEVFFHLNDWSRYQQDKDSYWVPWVSAWCGREQRSTYDVTASINFANIHPDMEDDLREVAKRLRDPQLRAPSQHANWVRLFKKEQRKPDRAVEDIVTALQSMNEALSTQN